MKSSRFFLVVFIMICTGPGCAGAPVAPEALPRVELRKVERTDFSLSGGNLTFRYRVTNPRSTTYKVEGLDYQVMVEGREVGSGAAGAGVTVAPKSEAEIAFSVPISLGSSPEEIQEAIRKLNGSFQVKGELGLQEEGAVLGSTTLPVTSTGEFPMPRLSEVRVHQATAARYSATEGAVTFEVAISNPNPFDVKIGGLTYTIHLEEVKVSSDTVGVNERIKAGTDVVYEVYILLDRPNFGEEVRQLLRKDVPHPYRLEGELDLGIFTVPAQDTGSITFFSG